MKTKRKIIFVKLLLGISVCVCLSVAFADQNIEIVGGGAASLPKIAVVGFAHDPMRIDHAADIIANDLSVTGEFKVIEYANRQEVESDAAYIVTGRFANDANIYYSLIDVQHKSRVLLSQNLKFTNGTDADNANFRQAAHIASNAVYKEITHTPGAFTSKIGFILQKGNMYQIVVADYDGYNQKTIVKTRSPLISLDWDSTGHKLAYVSLESGKPVVYVQDIYAGTRITVANFDGSNSSPEFTPSGSRLAVTLSKDYGSHIYLVKNAAYTGATEAQDLIHFGSIDTEASIANNDNMVFTSNHDGGPQIFMSNLTGVTPTRLTWNLGNYNTTARFSHDGTKITFISRNEGILKAYVLDLKTKSAYPVSLTTNLDMSPSFAPNDKLIIFSSDNGLYIVNTTGTIQTHLSHVNPEHANMIDQRWANN